MFKYIVVGAGLSGAVVAERIASQLNEKVFGGGPQATHSWNML